MKKSSNKTIDLIFKQAVENQNNKNFQEAEKLYNTVLDLNPNHVGSYNNLGIMFKNLDKLNEAKKCYEKAIEIDPSSLEANTNIGTIFLLLKEFNKARIFYIKALEINPNHIEPQIKLGMIYFHLGQQEKGIELYQKVLKYHPNNIDVNNNLGVAFFELGESLKAKECYEKVLQIEPNNVNGLNNLGILFNSLREHKKAKECYEKALLLQPNNINVQKNISNFYVSKLDNFEKATNSSYKVLEKYHEQSQFNNQNISLFRLKHDVQQAEYLNAKNYKIEGIDEFQKVGNEILSRKENKKAEDDLGKKILLTPDEINSLLPFYKADLVYQTKKISGNCINPNKNWQEVEDEYLNSSNQIMYIDNFLSDEALIELREFCLTSKVWNKEYSNKYLGAFSDSGFISPIHLQIAIDLKEKLPKLFGPHRLGKFWGFKYDSTLGKGINIHADFAIHNLNFWITPDEYNNKKNSGGLKVYDAPAPDNWTFRDYNNNNNKIYKFLKDNNSNCTNVPYKFNRAVLFNSAYFHETDEIDFKDEYKGRRINNTYLFGGRLVNKNR